MTTVYNDYYDAYRNHLFDINNVAFVAKLVRDTYIPSAAHKPSNVKDLVIVSAGALNGDVMTTKGMSEILQIMKQKLYEEMETNPNDVFELVDAVYADDNYKADKIKDTIRGISATFSEDNNQFWRDLKEQGLKYFVVEYPPLQILCFCEEIDVP